MILSQPKDMQDKDRLQRAFIGLADDYRFQQIVGWLKSEEQRLFRMNRSSDGPLMFRQQGALLALDDFFNYSDPKNARKVLDGMKGVS